MLSMEVIELLNLLEIARVTEPFITDLRKLHEESLNIEGINEISPKITPILNLAISSEIPRNVRFHALFSAQKLLLSGVARGEDVIDSILVKPMTDEMIAFAVISVLQSAIQSDIDRVHMIKIFNQCYQINQNGPDLLKISVKPMLNILIKKVFKSGDTAVHQSIIEIIGAVSLSDIQLMLDMVKRVKIENRYRKEIKHYYLQRLLNQRSSPTRDLRPPITIQQRIVKVYETHCAIDYQGSINSIEKFQIKIDKLIMRIVDSQQGMFKRHEFISISLNRIDLQANDLVSFLIKMMSLRPTQLERIKRKIDRERPISIYRALRDSTPLNPSVIITTDGSVEYLNMNIGLWEPAIEPFDVQIIGAHNINSLRAEVSINIPSILLNVSEGLLQTLKFLIERSKVLENQELSPSIIVKEQNSPYWIVNDSGEEIEFRLRMRLPKNTVLPTGKMPVNPITDVIYMNPKGFKPIPISLNSTDLFAKQWEGHVDDGDSRIFRKVRLMYRMNVEEGVRVIWIRSSIVVRNLTTIPLLLKGIKKGVRKIKEKHLGIIEPRNIVSIPTKWTDKSLLIYSQDIATNRSNLIDLGNIKSGPKILEYQKPEEIHPFKLIAIIVQLGLGDISCYTIDVHPPCYISNKLFHPLELLFGDYIICVPRGELTGGYQVPNLPAKAYIKICNIEGNIIIKKGDCDWILKDENGAEVQIQANVGVSEKGINIMIYAKTWIVNATGLPLYIYSSKRKIPYITGEGEIINNSMARKFGSKLIYYSPSQMFVRLNGIPTFSKKIKLGKREGNFRIISGEYSEVQIVINTSPGMYGRIITLKPSCIIINRSVHSIYVVQHVLNSRINSKTKEQILTIPIQTAQPMHFWADRFVVKMISIKFEGDFEWSSGFYVNKPGTEFIIMRTSGSYYIAVADVKIKHGTTYIFIREQSGKYPPYVIENHTNREVKFNQEGCNRIETIPGYQSQIFCWEDPTLPNKISFHVEEKTLTFEIDNPPLEGIPGLIIPSIRNVGPTKVITLTEKKIIPKKIKTREILYFKLNFKEIGLSIIDVTRELFYVSILDVIFIIRVKSSDYFFDLKVNEVQIDNQDLSSEYPVTLKAKLNTPFCKFIATKKRFPDVMCLENISFKLTPSVIQVDGKLLYSVINLIRSAEVDKYIVKSEQEQMHSLVSHKRVEETIIIYIENMIIHEMKFDIKYHGRLSSSDSITIEPFFIRSEYARSDILLSRLIEHVRSAILSVAHFSVMTSSIMAAPTTSFVNAATQKFKSRHKSQMRRKRMPRVFNDHIVNYDSSIALASYFLHSVGINENPILYINLNNVKCIVISKINVYIFKIGGRPSIYKKIPLSDINGVTVNGTNKITIFTKNPIEIQCSNEEETIKILTCLNKV